MSVLNKLKDAARSAKKASTSFGSNAARAAWTKHGDRICEAFLSCAHEASEKGSPFIADDDKYTANVIDPAWELLPTPVRLVGREKLRWDAMFLSARSKLFEIDGESVSVHPNAKERIVSLFAGKDSSGRND